MSRFTNIETEILNFLQKSFPLVERPFLDIGDKLGISEQEVLKTVSDLKAREVVRNIAGIFDGKKLGYHLSLVALKVPENILDKAAAVINSHPGVSHNYLRDHRYNVWFTLAEETLEAFEKSINIITRLTGAEDCLVLQNEKLYKIGFTLSIGEKNKEETKELKSGEEVKASMPLSGFSEKSIVALQQDLPLESHPFDILARESGISSGAELLRDAEELIGGGYMRRYAAVLRHRQAGYTSNAMTAWRVPDENVPDEMVRPFGEEKAVTHLYVRTLYPGRWEHRLFAMVHARNDVELNEIIDRLGNASGLNDRLILRSLKEFKKQKVMYFSPEFTDWKDKYYD